MPVDLLTMHIKSNAIVATDFDRDQSGAMRRAFEVRVESGQNSKTVVWAGEYDLSKEELWDRVRNPQLLAPSIPMLSEWKADGELHKGQTGREIHSFLPGIKTPFRWTMNLYEAGERWGMFSEPENSTVFNLPHYTEYKVTTLEQGGARLQIKFAAQLRGIFSLAILADPISRMMGRTVKALLHAVGNESNGSGRRRAQLHPTRDKVRSLFGT
jgi:hypothetical protein